MKDGQDEFFAVVGEGAGLLKNLDEQSSGFFDDLNRLREILAILGYASAVKPVQFSLSDRPGSVKSLHEYLETGIKVLPDELTLYELKTVNELGQLVGTTTTSLLPEALWEFQQTLKHKDDNAEAKRAVFDNIAARGVKHGIPQDDLAAAVQESDKILSSVVTMDPGYIAARKVYDEGSADRQRQVNEAQALIRVTSDACVSARQNGDADVLAAARAAREQAGEAFTELYARINKEQTDAWGPVEAASKQFHADRANACRALFDVNGKAILAKVLESSPVSEAEAAAWASDQIIDDNAKAKLKKLGYKPEDVVRDMAEFYRLAGGKASAIRIGLDGGRRANAVGITERLGEKVINLGSHFDKTVLFHELAHHLENDPIAKAASNGFLLKRREGEGVFSLRSLTGNKGFDAREIAYKDHFTDPYVGKVYRDGITEVFSMGVQYLATPKDAAIFAAKDPEMFALITGYLTMQTTPAMHAKLNMHKGVIGEMQEKKQTEEVQYERAVAYLAAKGALAKDDWYDTLDKDGELYGLLTAYVLYKVKKDRAVYVGSHGNFRVFSGVFRNRATKRASKGHVIVDISTGGTGESYRMNIPDHEIVHGGLDVVQAVIALTERDGATLFKAVMNYFVDSWGGATRKKNLIETVGAENLK